MNQTLQGYKNNGFLWTLKNTFQPGKIKAQIATLFNKMNNVQRNRSETFFLSVNPYGFEKTSETIKKSLSYNWTMSKTRNTLCETLSLLAITVSIIQSYRYTTRMVNVRTCRHLQDNILVNHHRFFATDSGALFSPWSQNIAS